MNILRYFRHKVVLSILGLLLIWYTVKFIQWFRSVKVTDIHHDRASSGAITPISVSVFYEALCPDSKAFIVKQLLPSVNKASRLLNISLVPYGKAQTEQNGNDNISFTCQHGPTECLANKIHACSILKISNPILLVRYISCMISDNMIPELIGENCAKEYNIDWREILQCSYSKEASILLKNYGILTDALSPKLTFVPTVLLDNKHENQAAILKDFFKQVCLMFDVLPEECYSSV